VEGGVAAAMNYPGRVRGAPRHSSTEEMLESSMGGGRASRARRRGPAGRPLTGGEPAPPCRFSEDEKQW
jgi:hypothetical protein